MSGDGPADDDFPEENPFAGLPFFGDLGKLLGGLGGAQGGGLQWDAARQVAVQLAAGGTSEPNVDPVARLDLEQLARVADLHVAGKTGLSTSSTGRAVSVLPVTRVQWVQRSLDAYRPLFESLATSLGKPAPPEDDSSDPLAAMMGQLMGAMGPALLGLTAGGLIGHLARRSFGQYDLPIPRTPSDELLVVHATVAEFADEWSLERSDLLLWVCVHEITHHAVLGVPHVRDRLRQLLREHAEGFQPGDSSLMERFESVDMSDPSALADLQGMLGDPEVVLGAIRSDAQRALLPRLDALVAVIEGYVDHTMDAVGTNLIGSYARITEAMRRRRVEADESDRFVSRLFGLELGQSTYDRGAAFVDGVVEREGFDALEPLWRDARFLPTPAEVDAPGLWLARIELPTD